MEKLNHLLKQAREHNSWTQQDVARKARIGLATYVRIEHGRQKARRGTIDRLVDLFKKSPEDLGFPRGPRQILYGKKG